jgi:hypothetical protein
MSDRRNDTRARLYVVTDEGRLAMGIAEQCACVLLMSDGFVICKECETAYSSIKQLEFWAGKQPSSPSKRRRD